MASVHTNTIAHTLFRTHKPFIQTDVIWSGVFFIITIIIIIIGR